MAIADAKVNVDYSLHLGVTNIKGEQLAQLEEAVWGHKIGSFKAIYGLQKIGAVWLMKDRYMPLCGKPPAWVP